MQTFPDDPWSLDMLDLLRDSVHHRNENDIGDAVPPTNNDSEKALRPAKTKLKVSGCFRSEEGAGNYATVASVIQTATGNGQNPFEFLRVIAILAQA
ncbi:MAG: transposase [Proteiniphilum sp.]|nr:transposase [Proteiniphilum sp.]